MPATAGSTGRSIVAARLIEIEEPPTDSEVPREAIRCPTAKTMRGNKSVGKVGIYRATVQEQPASVIAEAVRGTGPVGEPRVTEPEEGI